MNEPIYLFELTENGTAYAYDEAMAAACMQGLYNRTGPRVYVTCHDDERHRNGSAGDAGWGLKHLRRPCCTPQYWLKLLSQEGEWLHGRQCKTLSSLEELYDVTKECIRGAVIWDPAVPATVNVATTIAGVEDLVVLSPELYLDFGAKVGLPVACDLRGRFDGSETGSARNDAYRWAIRNYVDTGRCSTRIVGQYFDAWVNREIGNISYVLERDRLIAERAFAFDLSPWADFAPLSDPDQPLGTDKATLTLLLEHVCRKAGGDHMTEFCGFFNHRALCEGQPNGVLSEWETVRVISEYNFYQNTAANDVYNQSFHRWAPSAPLKQGRPKEQRTLENKVYFCIQICDMDSTTPLYDVCPVLWDDPRRGEYPLAWGFNPNLYGVLPDVYAHYYKTATENDYFCADAGAAGYFNPTRIHAEHWPMVTRHNQYWFERTDTTIAGMVLDCDHPTRDVLRHFAQFAPDGFASLVCSGIHPPCNPPVRGHIFDGMPVGFMTHAACDWEGLEKTCDTMNQLYFGKFTKERPHFVYYRITYRSPSEMFDLYERIRQTNPDLEIELVDPYTYFALLRQKYARDAAECAEDVML